MKKYIALALILAIALSLYSCLNTESETYPGKQGTTNNNDVSNDTSEMNKELADIIVTADVNPGTPREDMKEVFFEDERYIYSFNYPQSSVIKAVYTDGSYQKVKDALNDGNITVEDLDTYNIKYTSEPKLINTIIDHADRDGIGTPEALEDFYSDENYVYYFQSIRSHCVIVYFKDGTEKTVKDALRDGSVLIKDLDYFGISYYAKEPVEDDPSDINKPVTINIEIPDNIKAINVKRRDRTDGTTKTVLLTSVEDVNIICDSLESLTLKNIDYVKPIESAFELTFLDENTYEQKRVNISSNTTPYISFSENCCSIESGKFDVEFLESLFTDKKKEVVDITVTKVLESDVEESFYEDDVYIYIFGNPQSDYTVVKYSDGSKQKLVDALREGNIKITDLDTFGIKYYSEIKPVDNPELSYEVQHSSDYNIPTDLLPMIDAVDLIIVGTYDGTVSTYATETGQIYSIGRISDFYILKGEASLETKEITFYGGALPVSEFMKYVRPDISANRGFDKLTKLETDTKYVGVPVTQYSANPVEGTRYMFLLSYDDSTGEYFIACDGYGVREISAGGTGVWDPDTEEFEPYFAVTEKN